MPASLPQSPDHHNRQRHTRSCVEHSHIDRHGEGWETLREMLSMPDAWERTLAEFAKRAELEGQL